MEKIEVRLAMETINERECHEGEISNVNNQRMVKLVTYVSKVKKELKSMLQHVMRA